MNIKRLALLNLAAASILASVLAGCTPLSRSGVYVAPDPYVQKFEKQEAISQQQRRLMDF